jgi:hypothetical protein
MALAENHGVRTIGQRQQRNIEKIQPGKCRATKTRQSTQPLYSIRSSFWKMTSPGMTEKFIHKGKIHFLRLVTRPGHRLDLVALT